MSETPSNPPIHTRADTTKERDRLACVVFKEAHHVMGLTKQQALKLASAVRNG